MTCIMGEYAAELAAADVFFALTAPAPPYASGRSAHHRRSRPPLHSGSRKSGDPRKAQYGPAAILRRQYPLCRKRSTKSPLDLGFEKNRGPARVLARRGTRADLYGHEQPRSPIFLTSGQRSPRHRRTYLPRGNHGHHQYRHEPRRRLALSRTASCRGLLNIPTRHESLICLGKRRARSDRISARPSTAGRVSHSRMPQLCTLL
jgi:hypothetical protein